MLTKKNAGRASWIVAGALLLAGCTPNGPEVLLKGDRLLQEGKAAEAVRALEQAVELMPDNARAWNHLGLAYHAVGNAPEARKAYGRALQFDPNFPDPHFNLGSLEFEQGNYAGAEGPLRTFLAWQPRRADAWARLGQAQFQTRQFDSAERSLGTALQLERADAESWNSLGLIQLQKRRYREAAQQFAEAVRIAPSNAPARLNLAVTTQQYLGDRRAALQQYREYLALVPEPANAEGVRTIVRQLEVQLGLVAKPVVTNPPPVVSSPTNAPAAPAQPTNSVARVAPTNAVVLPPLKPTFAPPAPVSRSTTATSAVPAVASQPRITTEAPTNRTAAPMVAPVAVPPPTNTVTKSAPTSAPPVVKVPPPAPVATVTSTPPARVAETNAVVAAAPPPTKPTVVRVEESPSFLPARPTAPPPAAPAAEAPAITSTPAPAPANPSPAVSTPATPSPTQSDSTAATAQVGATSPKDVEGAEPPAKRGVLRKINPVNWFRRDDPAPSAREAEKAPAEAGGSKLNPLNWFRGKERGEPAPTPMPAEASGASRDSGPVSSPAGPGVREVPDNSGAAARVAPRPPPARYTRQVTSIPAAGNRTAAAASFSAGVSAYERKDYAAAVTAYRRAADADPGYFEAHHNLAVATLATGELPLSLLAAEYALALRPDSASTRLNFAVALQRSRYPVDAATELEKYLEGQPANARAHLMLAGIYALELDDVPRARSHYEATLAAEPQHPQAAAIRDWLASHPAR